MSDITAFDNDLNQKILTGQALDGFEKYYADDVVMQENSDAPFVGKDLNRTREIEFFGSIAEFHGGKLEASAVNADTTFGQWWMDITFKNGYRVQLNQVAVRKNGLEVLSTSPIPVWTELTVDLRCSGPAGRPLRGTGVVVDCTGNRHTGYVVSLMFMNLSRHAQERLTELAGMRVA